MASVVSAAVISGELIIGLDSGEIIRAGYVQGAQGLKGDQGPIGATGPAGVDGNTIHSVEGTPDGSLGKDGDCAIDRVNWRVHFPKAGGRWPQGVDMLARDRRTELGKKGGGGAGVTGGGGGGGSGPGGDVFTNQVLASGTGRLIELPVVGSSRVTVQYPGSPNGIIPPSVPMAYQSNINAFFVDALDQLDMAMPVPTTDNPPTADIYEGKLWFDTEEDELTLYIRYGGEWVPAAPPVSLDGIEASIANIDEELLTINRNVAINKSEVDERLLDFQIAQDAQDTKIEALETSQDAQDTKIDALEEDQERQDEKIAELEGEVDDLKPTVERGEWIYNSAPENKNNPEVGEYHAYVVVSDDYCKNKLAECLLNAAGDPILASECAREDEDCLAEIGNIDTDVPWHDVEWLVVHRNDSEGKSHTFGDVVAGMYIEAINVDGTGHGLYTINGKSLSPTRCGFQVTPVHSTGHPNGKAVIKIFSMADAANPEDYVMKSGDTMTGRLTLERPRTDENGNSFRIKGRINGEEGANLLKDYQRATDSTSSDYIDYFGGSPNSTSLINRGYVDDLKKYIFAPARYEWQARISSSGAKCPVGFVQFSGKSFADSNEIRISMTSFCKNFVMSKDGMTDQKTLYEREQGYNSAMVISAYFYKNNEWKWKGTSEIRKIIIMDQGEGFNYLKLALDNQKYANGDLFTDTHYYLTISGLF